MVATENERFYDEEVAPELLRLARACEARGMGFLCTVQYGEDDLGRTTALPAHTSDNMRMIHAAMQARGNIDSLVIAWARFARESGRPHGSIVLKEMGVPLGPG